MDRIEKEAREYFANNNGGCVGFIMLTLEQMEDINTDNDIFIDKDDIFAVFDKDGEVLP